MLIRIPVCVAFAAILSGCGSSPDPTSPTSPVGCTRAVTKALNGKTLIDRKEVEGMTAIAIDPSEAEPGPMVVQGDHGSVEFRTFTLTLLEKAGAKERE